jgi:hypothetical protein
MGLLMDLRDLLERMQQPPNMDYGAMGWKWIKVAVVVVVVAGA